MRWIWPIVVALAAPLLARAEETTPREMDGVDVVEHLNDQVPLDLTFTDEQGKTVRLGDYIDGLHPVILTLNYYACPMLCSMELNGLVEGIKGLDWTPGQQFQVVTVSIDPSEKPELAAAKKANYLKSLGMDGAEAGWHFLTGEHDHIKQLADTVGFGYRYDPAQKQFAHGAAIFVLSPQGKISRYLYGIEFPPKQLRLGLVEAGEGKTGSVVDRFLLRCYHYDPASRKYGVYVWGVMRAGGVLTMVLLGGFLMFLWRRERRT
jgi:protein SCO1/2